MFVVISIAAIVFLIMLFGSNTSNNTSQEKNHSNKQTHVPVYMSSPNISPDKRHYWDAYRQDWVRHYTFGDVLLFLVLGFIAGAGLLYYFGFIH
ncbi:MAG: hypothetical protein ACKVT2_19950 [Saprospiraceae bacterium]